MTQRTPLPAPSAVEELEQATEQVTEQDQAQRCCRRPMTRIEVARGGSSLTLHSCSACGCHVWERDGEAVDRSQLLQSVRTHVQENPSVPGRRRTRPVPAARQAPAGDNAVQARRRRADEMRSMLGGFTVHGR